MGLHDWIFVIYLHQLTFHIYVCAEIVHPPYAINISTKYKCFRFSGPQWTVKSRETMMIWSFISIDADPSGEHLKYPRL